MNSLISTTMKTTFAELILAALILPGFAIGQDAKQADDKKQKKEAKQNEKDDKRTDKQIRKYEEALAKANAEFAKNSDFKESVELDYRRLRREHATKAFEINTYDSGDFVLTNAGDKLPKSNDTLYDNLLAQDYVNRVGQSLVPQSSDNRYGFKITLNPMPDARSLSTGTVYVSTGLISLIDNEAQLAYVLAHEIAHIEKEHWKQDVLVAKWVEKETREQEKTAGIIGAAAGIFGGILGGHGSKLGDALSGAILGATVAQFLFKLIDPKGFEWSLAQENEADALSMQYMLSRNYDVREATAFYDTLKAAAVEDPRIELDRFADRDRAKERHDSINQWIAKANVVFTNKTIGAVNLRGKSLSMDRNTVVVTTRMQRNLKAMAEDIKQKLENGELMAGDGEFESILSTLKRDNGIVAFYYDLYKLSDRNLRQALAIRSDDAVAYFFYGRVLKLTARKPGEMAIARSMFKQAIELDKRSAVPQSRLYFALTKMTGRSTNNVEEIVGDLKLFVEKYQEMNAGALPPNMGLIYDYMQEAGETNWKPTAAVYVRNVPFTSQPIQQPAALNPVVSAPSQPPSKKRP